MRYCFTPIGPGGVKMPENPVLVSERNFPRLLVEVDISKRAWESMVTISSKAANFSLLLTSNSTCPSYLE